MLLEIEIRDFAIIDRLRLRLAPGFNVVTGETGAGKSIVVDAVDLILGGRADTAMVRAGCERALIEAVFDPARAAGGRAAVAEFLEGHGLEADETLILSREVYAAGRTAARVNGRAVPVKALSELGARLVDVHGQSDNVSLLREAEHLGLLDRYAGLAEERRALGRAVAELRGIAAALAELRRDEQARRERAESLAFTVEEIEAARLVPGEEAELAAERSRLANAERLALAAGQAYAALRGEADGDLGAAGLDRVDAAAAALEELARIDAALEPLRDTALGAAETLRDLADHLRDYRERLEFDPGRLEAIEERLLFITALKRKHGAADIPALLDRAERAAAERAGIEGDAERIAALAAEERGALEHAGALAEALSAARRAAAERLAAAVELELAALGMAESRFQVAIEQREDPAGLPLGAGRYAFDETGIDRPRFLVSMNPGEPLRALARVASGGETARLMLALKSILSAADELPTLIFDEIDAGIGGRVGSTVGQKLWGLCDRHQVLCVTHLPQVAAYGDAHFRVVKRVEDGRTLTRVEAIADESRVEELTQMLGTPTPVARENALQILQQSELWKVTARRARAAEC